MTCFNVTGTPSQDIENTKSLKISLTIHKNHRPTQLWSKPHTEDNVVTL